MRISELRRLPRDRLRARADADVRDRKPRRPRSIEHPAAILGDQPHAFAADRPSAAFRAGFDAARGCERAVMDTQPFSVTYWTGRREASFGLFETLLGAGAAQQERDGGERLRDRDRAGQAREKSRRGGGFEQQADDRRLRPSARRRCRRSRSAGAGAMGGARGEHAGARVGGKADHDDRFTGAEGAEVEILGAASRRRVALRRAGTAEARS